MDEDALRDVRGWPSGVVREDRVSSVNGIHAGRRALVWLSVGDPEGEVRASLLLVRAAAVEVNR